ncbi:hypothetical protein FLONG3_8952 [Fusarium longipes]|uniref:Uncharacterized protein n=1 Tax=Fusarium longipes TaxID=694270 RepID=A0A395S1D7_9HYPO|nr:hypothetical protein FLONG3_8952 [Fusarium longipes]
MVSFGRIEDEGGFEKLPSVVPDSQVTSNVYSNHIHVKRFCVPKEDLSISSISEGFSFGEKKPPRPGQFSERPKTEQFQPSDTSRFFSNSTGTLPRISLPNPPRPLNIQIPRPPPLDLPEIGLVRRQSSAQGSPTASHRDIASSPQRHEHYSPRPSPEESPQIGGADAAASCAESSKLPREELAPVVALHAPPPRTKAFSSSPRPASVANEVGTSRHIESKKHLGFVPTSERGHSFEHLKPPLPHISQKIPAHHRLSSPSTCGDLEVPSRQTPRAARQNRISRGHNSRQPVARSDYHRESDREYDRPQSRASNISRKRSSKRKARSRATTDPERKKLAMQNVAQHWNECIQISEAERIEAVREIARLEDEVHCAEEALEMTKQVVAEKDAAIQELTDLHKRRQEEGSLAEKESRRLLSEVESLRSDLAKSHEDKKAINEKSRKYRAKLNEAMLEQQDLFKRARVLYEETAEMQKDKKKCAENIKAVEVALEASRKKREELKGCVEQYRVETEREAQKKNHDIDELKTKLEHQQRELIRERAAASELQCQLKTESTLVDMVKNIQCDLSALKENNNKHNERNERQDKMTDCLSEKLDRMSDHIHSCMDSQTANEDVKLMLENLEANIVTRLASEIHNVISSQTNTAKNAACFQEIVQDHFEKLHKDMAEQQSAQAKNEQWFEDSRQIFANRLHNLSNKAVETQRICKEIQNDWAEFSASNSVWRDSFKDNLHNEIIKQLESRESKIVKLEETLGKVSHEWSKSLDIMRSSMLENGQQVEKHLQEAIRRVKDTLDKRFQEQSVASQADISKSEAIRSKIEAHLQNVRLQLEAVPSVDPESQILREALFEERKKTTDLQEHLSKLQNDASTSNELCQRGHEDLNAMETLRTQLEGMSERVPRVENLNTTFNKMIDLNQILQSTALYLSKEHTWVKDQLDAKLQGVAPREPHESGIETESGYFQGQHPEEPRLGVQAQSIGAKRSNTLVSVSTLDVHAQGDRYRRRVVVASPALESSLPAPAPSIAQEQQRRREPSAPRPILRTAAGPVKESEAIKAAANYDRYNRPVMTKASSSTGGANPAVAEQIRMAQVPKWDFPTMEDFAAEETISDGRDGVKPSKKRTDHADEGNDAIPAMKKIKSENQTEHGDASDM